MSAPVNIALAPATASVALGSNTLQLAATLYDVNGNVVSPALSFTWASSNAAILTVNSSGLCTTAAVESGVLNEGGQVTVTVTYPWGGIPGSTSTIYAQSVITVTAPSPTNVDSYYSEIPANPDGVSYRQGNGGSIRPIARVIPSE